MTTTPSPHPPSDEGFRSLINYLEEMAAALINGTGPQYLAILNFAEPDLVELENSGMRREIPGFRGLLGNENKAAVIKLKSGIPHEVATWMFAEMFFGERQRLGLPRNIFSLLQLREDARLWLEKTNGETKIVLRFSQYPSWNTGIERWQHAPSPPLPRNSGSLFVPDRVQLVTYDNNAQQISIDGQELLSYGVDLFDGLG
ncbi:hypothetical protein V1525DRAFT_451738 [Lipomyces kononenkoae]|uniref:Uncharacterized protein n=1 Tax=Lipomyces kononenkoae TaxID=34357 RepID=A0ACC3SWP6_LIPKO